MATSSMPKSVRVGPFTMRIQITDDILPDKLGQLKETQLRILIAPDQAPVMERDTVLHEVLHACFLTVNMRDAVDFETEERVVMRLATVLLQVLRSNHQLVDYLTS